MSTRKTLVGNVLHPLRPLAFGAVLVAAPSAWAALSQSPLITSSGSGALPNLMLTLDTSGSMASEYMPDGSSISVGTRTYNGSIAAEWSTDSTLRRTGNGANVASRALRSPQVNRIYYDPSVRYLPWKNQDATSWTAASKTAAYFDPTDTSAGSFNVSSFTSGSTPTSNAVVYILRTGSNGLYLDPNTAGNYDEIDINAGSNFTKYPARTDCVSKTNACSKDEELQNFANWFQFHRTRLLLTKAAMFETFAGMDTIVRLGWGQIRNGLAAKYCYLDPYTGLCGTYFDYFPATPSVDGVSNVKAVEQGVRDLSVDHRKKLFTWIRDLDASGGTPLRGAMKAVGDYFSRTDASGPWSNTPGGNDSSAPLTCRRAYNILTTDGYYNVDRSSSIGVNDSDGDGVSNTLADVASYYYKKDLNSKVANGLQASTRDPATWQHLVQFTVGLGVNGTLDPTAGEPSKWPNPNVDIDDNSPKKNDDLWHAAVNSKGQYYSARDGATLAKSLRTAMADIRSREGSESGVAAAAPTLTDGNLKYVPTYKTGDWSGELTAYKLDAKGVVSDKVWTASAMLPPAASRNIVTWDAVAGTPTLFQWGDLSISQKGALTGVDEKMLNFLRGDSAYEGSTFRDRTGPLGDMVGSPPLVLGGAASIDFAYGSLPTIGASYGTFLNTKRARATRLFIGGNDGMLHVYNGATGIETFAYVPAAVHGKLASLASVNYGTPSTPHQFYVNGPQIEADAYVKFSNESAASWHNLVVGTFGAGGKGLYLIDATDSTNLGKNAIKWELSAGNDLGSIFSDPQIGVLPSGEWKVFVGNGYDSVNKKAALLIIDVATGKVDKTLVATGATTGDNGLGGVRLVKNAKKQVVAAYAGDLLGNLWRFDFVNASNTANSSSSDWVVGFGGSPVFVAKAADLSRQPITATPVVYPHPQGGNVVVFGTGKLLDSSDPSSNSAQAFYGVRDKTLSGQVSTLPAPSFTRDDLVRQTITATPSSSRDQFDFYDVSSNSINWATKFGWFIDLNDLSATMPGLRDIYPVQRLNNEFVLMTAVAPSPSTGSSCGISEGKSISFVLPALTGGQYEAPVLDVTGDGIVNSKSNKIPVDARSSGFSTGALGEVLYVHSVGGGGSAIGDGGEGTTDGNEDSGTLQDSKGGLTIDLPSGDVEVKSRVWRTLVRPPL